MKKIFYSLFLSIFLSAMIILIFMIYRLNFAPNIDREVFEYSNNINVSSNYDYETLIYKLFQKYLYEAFLDEWIIYDIASVSRHLVRRIADEINDERADVMAIIDEKYSYLIGTHIYMDKYTVEIDGETINSKELFYRKSINPTDPSILMSYIPTPFELLGPGYTVSVNVIFDFNPNISEEFQRGFNFFFMDRNTLFLIYDEVIFSLIRHSKDGREMK